MTTEELNLILGKMGDIKDAVTGLKKDFENVDKMVMMHSTELWGDTSDQKPGLVKKVDRMIEKQKDRTKIMAVMGSVIGFLGLDKIWAMFKAAFVINNH